TRPRRAPAQCGGTADGGWPAAARRGVSGFAPTRGCISSADRTRSQGARAARIRADRHRAVAALHLRTGVTRARTRKPATEAMVSAQVLDAPDSTVLDMLDRLLNKGVVLNGDVTLGVAGIDLIYLRLSSILCAADRVLPAEPSPRRRKGRRRTAAA